MRQHTAAILVLIFVLSFASPLSEGKEDGKFNTTNGCTCHYSGGTTTSLTGTPTEYSPGQTYSLTITVAGGGTGKGGFSMNVNKGSFSNPGTSVKINSADNKQATHSNPNLRTWTLDWNAPSSGSGTATFDWGVIKANGNGQNTGDDQTTDSKSVPESVSNSPPSVSNVQISPSSAFTGDTLSLTYNYNDGDGDSESGTQIRWYKNSNLVSTRNNMNTVPSSMTMKGETWDVEVTPSDGTDQGSLVQSNSVTIQNSAPVASGSINPSTPMEDDDLTLSWSGSDADTDQTTLAGIEWFVDGSVVETFDDTTTVPSIAIRSGDVWHARVMVNDGEMNSLWFTVPSITVGSSNSAPTMLSVTLAGPYTTVDDLIASALANDADGDSLTYEWQWVGSTITTNTLSSVLTTKGDSWTVKCRVTDGSAYSAWMESSPVIIQNSAPVIESLSIDQDTVWFQENATWSHVASDVDGDQITILEQWSQNGDELTLTIQARDTDMSLSPTVSDTVLIVNAPPSVSFDGELSQDSLSDLAPVFTTDDLNSDAVTLSYEWMRNGYITSFNSSAIPASSLAPEDTWIVAVTPNDGMDDGETLLVEFTISNIAPSAAITMNNNALIGVPTTLSAAPSVDIDGVIYEVIWTIDSMTYSGLTIQYVPTTASTNVSVTVYDYSGASSSHSAILLATPAPTANNVNVKIVENEVTLSWSGDADEWAIYRDGAQIGTTTDNKWKDQPPIEGDYTYGVGAVVDGTAIPIHEETSASLAVDDSIEEQGPATTAGLIIGIVMILIGGAGVALSFIPRRD